MLGRTRVPLQIALIAAMAAPAAATADRKPTTSERAAIAKVWPTPLRCTKVRVSTVDRKFASVRTRLPIPAGCSQFAGNGIQFLRKRDGRWRIGTGMSDCPYRVSGVPLRVYRDLTRSYCDGDWQEARR